MSDVASIRASHPGSPVLQGPPRTIAALIQSVESKFHCVQGPPLAYFELHTSSAQDAPIMRCLYSTIKFSARGYRPDTEPMLVQAMEDEFKALLAKFATRHNFREALADGLKPMLFWRRIPEIEEHGPEPEGTDANGSWVAGRPYPITSLRCRFFIEGLESFNDSGMDMVFLREVQ